MALTSNEADFAKYLAELWLQTPEYPDSNMGKSPHWHCYPISKSRVWNSWKERGCPGVGAQRKQRWWSNNLQEAAVHYSWPQRGDSFESLALELQAAIEDNDSVATVKICLRIFAWGGVARRRADVPQDASRVWVEDKHARDCVKHLRKIRSDMTVLDPESAPFVHDFDSGRKGGARFLMNSAMTKIYAASDTEGRILMYDGRVGAALCLLAKKFLALRAEPSVPNDLMYLWGRGYGQSTGVRDPSDLRFKFRELHQAGITDLVRAQVCVRAARVLLATSEFIRARTCHPGPTLRELEKALFMIGFDVRDTRGQCWCTATRGP